MSVEHGVPPGASFSFILDRRLWQHVAFATMSSQSDRLDRAIWAVPPNSSRQQARAAIFRALQDERYEDPEYRERDAPNPAVEWLGPLFAAATLGMVIVLVLRRLAHGGTVR